MALLAEELVEEWVNRQGYCTIRGVKAGVHEIDVLAVRQSGGLECRHLEVQASVRPVSYITRVPVEIQRKTGRAPGSAKMRPDDELRQGIKEWISKKFDHPEKRRLMNRLAPGPGTWGKAIHKSAFLRVIELLANPLFDSLPELIVWSHFRAAWSPTGLPLDLDWYPCDVAHWSNRRLYLQMPTLKSARLANREDINLMNARFYSSDRAVSLTIHPLFDKLLS